MLLMILTANNEGSVALFGPRTMLRSGVVRGPGMKEGEGATHRGKARAKAGGNGGGAGSSGTRVTSPGLEDSRARLSSRVAREEMPRDGGRDHVPSLPHQVPTQTCRHLASLVIM